MLFIQLDILWILVIAFVFWMIVHLGVAYIFRKVNDFDYNNFIFRLRKWEKNGLIYEKIFKIKRWKGLLPSGDELFKNLPHKNLLAKKDLNTLKLFIKETCRAEMIHLVIMLSSLLFFIFAHWIIAVAMMGYAFLENIWCIMTQRYNRARLIKILKK